MPDTSKLEAVFGYDVNFTIFKPSVKSILMLLGDDQYKMNVTDCPHWQKHLPTVAPGHEFIIASTGSSLEFAADERSAPRPVEVTNLNDGELTAVMTGLLRAVPTGSIVFCHVSSDDSPVSQEVLDKVGTFISDTDKERLNIVLCHHAMTLQASTKPLRDAMVAQALVEKAFVVL